MPRPARAERPRGAGRSRPALLSLLLLVPLACVAAKTDKVLLENGDTVTCEIKGLDRGKLECSTANMGTVYMEWNEVLAVTSDQGLLVELAGGTRLYGHLAPIEKARFLRVELDDFRYDVDMQQVVRVTPIKSRLVGGRLKADFSLGFNFTKSSDVAQLNSAVDLRYRTRRYLLRFDGSTIVTKTGGDSPTQNTTLPLSYRYFLKNRYFALALGGLQRNDELGIDARVTAGGGGGRWMLQTNRSLLSLYGGATLNREYQQGADRPLDSVEALLAVDYELFVYDTPKRDIQARAAVFPSLTESGRVRSELDTSFKLELVKDLFWELRLYASQDTQPGQDALSESDYGVVTSLGYSL